MRPNIAFPAALSTQEPNLRLKQYLPLTRRFSRYHLHWTSSLPYTASRNVQWEITRIAQLANTVLQTVNPRERSRLCCSTVEMRECWWTTLFYPCKYDATGHYAHIAGDKSHFASRPRMSSSEKCTPDICQIIFAFILHRSEVQALDSATGFGAFTSNFRPMPP